MRKFSVIVAMVMAGAVLSAQGTTPSGVMFTASSNHATAVTRYSVELEQNAAIVRSRDIGKPTPDAAGEILMNDPTFFQGLSPGGYVVFVTAIGPGGSARSGGTGWTNDPPSQPPDPPSNPGDPVIVNPPPNPPGGSTDEVVIYASDIQGAQGFVLTADASAAPGGAMWDRNVNAPKVANAVAQPATFFDVPFTVRTGVPYHIWFRMKAERNQYDNDSVYVQFSGARDASGNQVAPIGSTVGLNLTLEDRTSAGVSGWGWQDTGFSGMGPHYYFAQPNQTMRIQRREDGVSIDQVVISAGRFLTSSPGTLKDDSTIVAKP